MFTLLPILLGCVTTVLIFTCLLDPSTAEKSFREEEILSTIEAVTSHEYRYSIFTCIGMMIPFITDQMFTFSVIRVNNDPTLASRIEPYIVPFLVTITQFFNIYFITEDKTTTSFWWYYQGTAIQLIVIFTTYLTTQAINTEKYPRIQMVICWSSLFVNVGIFFKIANFLTLGITQKIFFYGATLAYVCSIICNGYIAYERLQNYWMLTKMGMKEAKMELCYFYKINLMSMGIVAYAVMDYFCQSNQYILYYAKGSAVGLNVILIVLIYGFIEIHYSQKRDLAKVSIETLEMKRNFVRHVSHEIRTPLNSASLGLQLLAKEANKKHVQATNFLELIEDTSHACNIAIDILNDLLLYEKIDGGMLTLETAVVNVQDFVADVVRLFNLQAKAFEIDLVFQNMPLKGFENMSIDERDELMIEIDVYKMSQVVRNLLSNALKFSRFGSQVTISFALHPMSNNQNQFHHQRDANGSRRIGCGDYVRISVTDSGAGISPANQKRLFDEIIQFDAAKLQEGKGSGFGLWISKKIVSLHAGNIGVSSEGLNCGSSFYIDIPLAEKRKKAEEMFLPPGVPPFVGVEDCFKDIPHVTSCLMEVGEKEDEIEETYSPTTMIIKKTLSRLKLIPVSSQYSIKHSSTPSSPFSTTNVPISSVHVTVPSIPARRLLIVDDSPVNRKMLKRMLQEVFEVIDEATHGLECLQKLQVSAVNQEEHEKKMISYDIIIMDYWMPQMNGLETVKVLRSKGYTGKIIGLTGNSEKEMNDNFQAAGVDLLLTKPYQGIDMVQLFQELLNEQQPMSAL